MNVYSDFTIPAFGRHVTIYIYIGFCGRYLTTLSVSRLYCVDMTINECGEARGMRIVREDRNTCRKPAQWDRTWTTAFIRLCVGLCCQELKYIII
jgi:hypothetical protein